jgi:hypothetical protein
MAAFADSTGGLYTLYRSARQMVHRDMYLLFSPDGGQHFTGSQISPWNVGYCVMSSAAFAEGSGGVRAAWETERQVYYASVDRATGAIGAAVAAPAATPDAGGKAPERRYPALAVNARGETLLAWTEGMGWKRGGSVAWQVFDGRGRPEGAHGTAPGVPAWSLVAAFARPDGSFAILY